MQSILEETQLESVNSSYAWQSLTIHKSRDIKPVGSIDLDLWRDLIISSALINSIVKKL